MASSTVLGTVLNKNDVHDKISGPVKAAITLAIGLVFEDGALGWDNAPVDGSVPARRLYWNPTEINNSTGVLGKKHGTFYGDNALFVGKADGVIVVDESVQASQTAAHNGQLQTIAEPTEPGAAYAEAAADSLFFYVVDKVASYKGHVDEIKQIADSRTDAIDEDEDCVFQIRRGT